MKTEWTDGRGGSATDKGAWDFTFHMSEQVFPGLDYNTVAYEKVSNATIGYGVTKGQA